MSDWSKYLLIVVTLCLPSAAFADVPAKRTDRDSDLSLSAARSLVAAVNTVAAADIGIPPADVATPCPIDTLPSSRAKLIPLLPAEHQGLIADCARGRLRVKRGVREFDLMAMLEDPVDDTNSAATIRAFFDERMVDVAMGEAVSEGPYPITFDWVVVLDAQAKTLFSFILNCRD